MICQFNGLTHVLTCRLSPMFALASIATICILCFFPISRASASDADAQAEEPSVQDVFTLEKGDYVFVGMHEGDLGKGEREIGIKPLAKWHVSQDTRHDNWFLKFSMAYDVDEENDFILMIKATWQRYMPTLQQDGTYKEKLRTQQIFSWWPLVNEKEQLSDFETEDVSEDYGIDGLMVLHIPYAQSDQETKYVLIAISEDPKKIADIVKIQKAYFMFNWDRWRTIKEQIHEDEATDDKS